MNNNQDTIKAMIETIRFKFFINFSIAAVATAFVVSLLLLFWQVPFYNVVVVFLAGIYYAVLLVFRNKNFIRNNLSIVVYGAYIFIFYALADPSLAKMTPSFLFFFPIVSFFLLKRTEALVTVFVYIFGITLIYLYNELSFNWIYSPQQAIFSVIAVIFTSMIGYIISNSRDKAENMYAVEAKKYQNYKLAVNQATNHIILTDINGKILFANEAAEIITGFRFSEMLDQTPRLWGGLQTPEFYTNLWKTIKIDKKKFSGTIQNRRKNGELYTAIANIAPILDVKNELIGFIGSEEDITKLTLLENKLAEDKKRDETLLFALGEGVVAQDKNKRVVMINKAAQNMLLYTEKELLGKSFVEIVKAESIDGKQILSSDRPLTVAKNTREPIKSQLTYIRKDGTKFESELIITPVYIDEIYFGDIQVFKDITKEKQVDRMKTEFISLASHQLRTPLSAMKWFSEMLLAGDAGNLNTEQLEFVKNISDSNDRMIDLVNSLLNISRIESGRILIDPRPTDLQELVREITDELKKKSSDKNINIVMSANENLPRINCDPKMMRQVYINLLTNAIKYTKSGGEIQIFISKKDNEIISQVSDNGMGIPIAEQPKIFQRFFRASNIIKKETDGTGLGLYLAKAIMESSGGKIWFKSEEGNGTSFFISLPIEGSKSKQGEVSINS